MDLSGDLRILVVPEVIFEDLGIKYTGPVDGHDLQALEAALQLARDYEDPVIVHVKTEKGRGYSPAEEDVADRFHAVGKIHPETGLPVVPSRFGWTKVLLKKSWLLPAKMTRWWVLLPPCRPRWV